MPWAGHPDKLGVLPMVGLPSAESALQEAGCLATGIGFSCPLGHRVRFNCLDAQSPHCVSLQPWNTMRPNDETLSTGIGRRMMDISIADRGAGFSLLASRQLESGSAASVQLRVTADFRLMSHGRTERARLIDQQQVDITS